MIVHTARAAFVEMAVAGLAFAQMPAELVEGPEHGWPGLHPGDAPSVQTTWDPDGPGPEEPWLVVGGLISEAGNVPAANLAVWDGQAWSALGDPNDEVTLLAVHNGDLIVGGNFTEIGGATVPRLARYDGNEWHALIDEPFVGGLEDAATMPDGRLLLAGNFDDIDGVPAANVAAWDGSAWAALGAGRHQFSRDILVLGDDVYVVGGTNPAGRPAVDRWDGSIWQSLTANLTGGSVWAIESWFGQLIIGGRFNTPGWAAANVARFDGTSWQPLLPGIDHPDNTVTDVHVFDGDVIIAGRFNDIGSEDMRSIARFDGTQWRRLRVEPMYFVDSLGTYGDDLVAVGSFQGMGDMDAFKVARWNGLDWAPVGIGIGRSVLAIQAIGDTLYLGGHFTAAGGLATSHVAAWDGRGFSALGLGLDGPVEHMADLDGTLVVSGPFTRAGLAFTDDVATWDGSAWRGLGDGPGDTPNALAVYQGQIYAAGSTLIGRPDSLGIARWNGTQWEPVGRTFRASAVDHLVVVGDKLWALGTFSDRAYAAAWDGAVWRVHLPDVTDYRPTGAAAYVHPTLGNVLVASWYRFGRADEVHVFDGDAWARETFGRIDSAAPDGDRLILSSTIDGAGEIGAWDGSDWTSLVDEVPAWASAFKPTMAVYRGELFTGLFATASTEARGWVRWTLDPCRVDLDGDGDLTIFDLLAFQNLFQDADPLADFDDDGEFTIFDFLTFQNEFDLGCD